MEQDHGATCRGDAGVAFELTLKAWLSELVALARTASGDVHGMFNSMPRVSGAQRFLQRAARAGDT